MQVESGNGDNVQRMVSFNPGTALNRYVTLAKTSIIFDLRFLRYGPEQTVVLLPASWQGSIVAYTVWVLGKDT